MKTTCSLLKQYTLPLILLLNTTIFIYSCKKDKENHSVLSADEIKKWYISNANTFNTESKIFEHKSPDFTKPFVSFKDGLQITEFKFDTPNKLVFDNGTSTDAEKESALDRTEIRMLFLNSIGSKSINKAAFMVIVGKYKEDLAKVHYKDFSQFSGRIIFYHSNGTLANGYKIENGNVLKSFGKASLKPNELLNLKLRNQAKIGINRIASGAKLMLYDINSNCFEFVTTSEQTCVSFNATRSFSNKTGVEEPKRQKLMVGNDMYCKWMISGEYVGSECQSSGNDGGYNGGSGNTGGPEGGGSGSGGNNSNKEIIDSVKNPCVKNALALALSKDAVNDIKTLFYNTFGSDKNYNVVFTDGSLNSNLDAKTSTKPNDNGIMTSTITFNTNVGGIRSEQYVVATVYHEMIHAELRKLFPESPLGEILIPSQHDYMAENYVNQITASLKSIFPNLSDDDAWALSWGGLKQTSFFDLLSDANKTLIGETLMKYSDKDRYDKLGSYCN